MRVLTAQEMQRVDRRAIDEFGVPSLVLMENAAIGIADALAESFPTAETVCVLCGPGNNGGDGLALVRHLEARGYGHRTYLVLGNSPPKGDAAVQLDILVRAELGVETVDGDSDLEPLLEACRAADVVVDALFGTGLSRPLEGHFAALVDALDRLPVPLLAVDVPSGLDGSGGGVPGPHARAEVTVTFAAPKVAHVLPPASQSMGRVIVTDLGIPPHWVDEAPGDLHLPVAEEMAASLLERPAESHKGTFGHALLVAGGPGTLGAALLATRAAVRGGAGLVTVAVPESLAAAADTTSLESMTLALPAGPDGGPSDAAVAAVVEACVGKAAVGIGPGLGTDPATAEAVRHWVSGVDGVGLPIPLVLDAGGLDAYAGGLEALQVRQAPTVLTPHPGEMGRLLGIPTQDVQADRLAAVRRASEASGAIVVLKGHRSLVAAPAGGVWINPTGNAGMATGGIGDVLTGLLVALLGQGYEPLVATQLGVWLHGLAGDLALVDGAPESLAAGDLLDALPRAFRRTRHPEDNRSEDTP